MTIKLLIFLYFFNSIATADIICNSEHDGSYDCSNKNLNFSGLGHLCEATYSASSLNLANNNLNFSIFDFTFNKFKLIKNILNLSSNNLEKIEKYAFYHDLSLIDDKNNLMPLNIFILDLSNNHLKHVPWSAFEKVSTLRFLYLNNNAISKIDMNDFNPSNYFENLTHLYLSSCGLQFIDNNIFVYLTNLILLDVSYNKLKSLDVTIGHRLIANSKNTNIFTYINTNNNPLECNCHLL